MSMMWYAKNRKQKDECPSMNLYTPSMLFTALFIDWIAISRILGVDLLCCLWKVCFSIISLFHSPISQTQQKSKKKILKYQNNMKMVEEAINKLREKFEHYATNDSFMLCIRTFHITFFWFVGRDKTANLFVLVNIVSKIKILSMSTSKFRTSNFSSKKKLFKETFFEAYLRKDKFKA
jgi:hypothetical protein